MVEFSRFRDGKVAKMSGESFAWEIADSARILREAIEMFNPTHIVSMVSGGKDSACSDAVAREIGTSLDLVIHGNTRCGIKRTSEFVENVYGNMGTDYAVADAGTAYQDYVLRKGFFGKGHDAHAYAYRILKATPFRKTISKYIRQGKREKRVLLLNGARKDESENRQKHLPVWRQDPASMGDIWVSLIYNWSQEKRDAYLDARATPINPVAAALCRSGECLCGTMQTRAERIEASLFDPEWGDWITVLEKEVVAKHGFGWGASLSDRPDPRQIDMFQPMCKNCLKGAA